MTIAAAIPQSVEYAPRKHTILGYSAPYGKVTWISSKSLLAASAAAMSTHGSGCPAYAWGGCRGQGSDDPWNDEEEWFAFYERTRGFTREQFFG